MILGEHAVLEGYPAVVAAINQRIYVKITPTLSQNITLEATGLGSFTTSLEKIEITPPFTYALSVLKTCEKELSTGLLIKITSDFPPTLGLSSSAAITVALLAGIRKLIGLPLGKDLLLEASLQAIRNVQAHSSGADLAAAIYGGVLGYIPGRFETLPNYGPGHHLPYYKHSLNYHLPEATPLNFIPNLHVIYSGTKMPTSEVIQKLQEKYKKNPTPYQKACAEIGVYVQQGMMASKEKNWTALGKIFTKQQNAMENIGLMTPSLTKIQQKLQQLPSLLGYKISGAGLGDCMIALGEIPENTFSDTEFTEQGIRKINLDLSEQGLSYE